MKRAYTAPKLTSFGNVAEITQITGKSAVRDFTFLNGVVISDQAPDQGSFDICLPIDSPGPSDANCDPRL